MSKEEANRQFVLLERGTDGVATLRLNRPEKFNAFTIPMIDQWYGCLKEAIEDSGIKVIILAGTGRAFCAGGDADDVARLRGLGSLGRKQYLSNHIHKIPLALHGCSKPTIAAVNGPARGAGMDMAVMCDLRLASHTATFAESYIDLGLIAGDAGTYYLPRLIGASRALELFWTGRVVDADEALRIGLVNRVVSPEDLMAAAQTLAAKIAAQPDEAIQMFRRATYDGLEMSLPAHLDTVSSHMAVLMDTPEHHDRLERVRERLKGRLPIEPS